DHARQLVLVVDERQQSPADVHIPSWYGEGVWLDHVHHLKFIGDVLAGRFVGQPLAQGGAGGGQPGLGGAAYLRPASRALFLPDLLRLLAGDNGKRRPAADGVRGTARVEDRDDAGDGEGQ